MDGLTRTAAGSVRGVNEDGIWVFRGIPYARDPSGSQRWRQPAPPEPWTAVREADHFGPIAPQSPPVPGMSIRGDPSESAEDCLNLNVWTPGIDDARRPVMVWIHGGGFTTGTGSSLLYRGQRLARLGVVVVTINYRLGALGFLASPGFAEAGSGWANWGLSDQLAALGWVQQNIAEFGGDPRRVTVFGESAGGMSISALLSSSAAEGLFHRAVVQSGPPTCGSEEWAKRRSARFVEKVQEAPDKIRGANQQELVRKVLEDVAAPDLVSATQRMEPDREGLPLPFLPVVDGAILREVPPDAIRKNKGHRVPLMIGTNRDECTFFALGDPRAQGMDEEALHRRVAVIAGHDFAGPLVNQYRNIRSARLEAVTPLALWIAITTDLVFRMPSLGFAEAQLGTGADVFSYLFTWSSPFLGGILGSAHALEVPFVFGSVNEKAVQPYSGSGPAALALSEAMMRAWVAFASTGNPSCDEAGDWPVFGTEKRDTMVFGEHTEVQQDPRSDEREAWTGSGVDMANRLYQE